MALGTSITDNDVRDALGSGSFDVFTLCTDANINKWSKNKPIRDAGVGANWPAGADGYYGLSIPVSTLNAFFSSENWTYNKPRGGSWDGSPYDEPGRLDDFRGYEKNSNPPIYISSFSSGTINPLVNAAAQFEITINTNSANGLLPSDLSLNDYYFGIRLQCGANYVYLTNPDTIGNGGSSVGFNVTDPVFNDLEGEYTWVAFLCDHAISLRGNLTGDPEASYSVILLPETTLYDSTPVYHSGIFMVESSPTIAISNVLIGGYNPETYEDVVVITNSPAHWEMTFTSLLGVDVDLTDVTLVIEPILKTGTGQLLYNIPDLTTLDEATVAGNAEDWDINTYSEISEEFFTHYSGMISFSIYQKGMLVWTGQLNVETGI